MKAGRLDVRWFLGAVLVCALGACVDDAPSVLDEPTAVAPPAATRLVVLLETSPPSVAEFDFQTKTTTTLFSGPSLSFTYELAVSRDEDKIIVSYTPPPEEGVSGFDRAGLYRLDENAGAPTHIACAEIYSWCFFPTINGDTLWFVRSGEGLPYGVDFVLAKLELETGVETAVIDWATEPAVSPDGTLLAWIAVDPLGGARTLELGDATGRHVRTLVPLRAGEDIGQPFFAADGKSVFFVRIPPTTTTTFLDTLTSWVVPVAHAHNNHSQPGDWWNVSTSGETDAVQISFLATVFYDGVADPGGEWIFTVTREGIQKVHVATGAASVLLSTRLGRAVTWRGN